MCILYRHAADICGGSAGGLRDLVSELVKAEKHGVRPSLFLQPAEGGSLKMRFEGGERCICVRILFGLKLEMLSLLPVYDCCVISTP